MTPSEQAERAAALRRIQTMAMREQSASMLMADAVGHRLATYVPGRGSLSPRVAFVCERPSPSDAALRAPLTGPAGRLFDRLLTRVGLTRAEVYVTHLVPWRLPNNRPSLMQEMNACGPWLRRELRTLGAPPVVLLGRHISEHLMAKPYSEVIGEIGYSIGLRVHCLNARHPAYGVYQSSNVDVMAGQYQRIRDLEALSNAAF